MSAKEFLLSFLQLDKHYVSGENDWLIYMENDKSIKVLDLVGSYGINLLGHNNQEVKAEFLKVIDTNQPAFIQGSYNPKADELSQRINELLNSESHERDRFCEFTNTGTEAIEIALKLCMLDYQNRLEKVRQHISYTENILLKVDHVDSKRIISENRKIDFEGTLLHLEKSFHGKTLGSLSAIGNKNLKKPFKTALRTKELKCTQSNLESIVEDNCVSYWVYNQRNGRLLKKSFCTILAILLEPIRCEGGVLDLSVDLVQEIKVKSKKHDFPIISDEIQTGLFRTRKMAALHHYGIEADIYCFAKGLGGGYTKIGAVSALENRFDRHFFRYHSSSFGEDAFSLAVGCKVLDVLKGKVQSNFPQLGLFEILKEKFPDLVKSVRGKGLLFAFELNLDMVLISYLRKYLSNINMAGYWISSVLLNREKIRILPTLSAPLTFRIEPSIHFSSDDLQFAINGLVNFLNALKNRDTAYLFDHILPIETNVNENEISLSLIRNEFPENAAVFLCHPIDIGHFQSFFDLTTGILDSNLKQIVKELAPIQEFYPYHISQLEGGKGNKIDVVYLGIPLTSESFYEAIKSGRRADIIAQIQRAVNWANKQKAKVVGLGQFTSIITENGLRIESKDALLTTGNAFTAQATIEAMTKALLENNLDMENSSFGIVGASGNIMSVITKIVSVNSKHLTLIFNKSIWNVKKNVDTINDLITYLSKHHSNKALRRFLSHEIENKTAEEILHDPFVISFITISTSVNALSNCNVVLTGTNAPEPFIDGRQLLENAIVVDLAVPPNVKADSLSMEQTYIKGGIIQLPTINGKEQVLNSAIFPLDPGESYACMAETMALALDDFKGDHLIGDIDVETVELVDKILKRQGFQLKRSKTDDSV